MKKTEVIFEDGDHKWLAIARDPEKPGMIIDTVEYLIINGDKAALPDPGGIEIFPAIFSAIGKEINAESIQFLFASHQDPDIISSLPMWLSFNPKLKCYVSWLWSSFIPHFGCEKDTLVPIPDEGMQVMLNETLPLQFIPAHYLHSSGNFHLYDAKAKVYFSGDIGAALLPSDVTDIYVTDFSNHTQYMEGFHRRWLGSNEAKNAWIDRVSKLDINLLCPQHGSIFRGEDIPRFLQWLRDLKVGEAGIQANSGKAP